MKHLPIAATLLLLTSLVSTSLIAETAHYSPALQLAQNNSQSLNRAIHSIKQETGGKVLSSKTVKIKGQTIFKIKVLLPSGKVKTFKVAAD